MEGKINGQCPLDTLENQNAHCSKYTMVIWCRPTFSDGLSFGFVAKLYHVRTDSLVTLVLGCLGTIWYLPRFKTRRPAGNFWRPSYFGGIYHCIAVCHDKSQDKSELHIPPRRSMTSAEFKLSQAEANLKVKIALLPQGCSDLTAE